MTCREFADFLSDYLSNELSPTSRRTFDDHLLACINCQRYLTSYRESIALGRHAFDDEHAPVWELVPEELVGAILAARARR